MECQYVETIVKPESPQVIEEAQQSRTQAEYPSAENDGRDLPHK